MMCRSLASFQIKTAPRGYADGFFDLVTTHSGGNTDTFRKLTMLLANDKNFRPSYVPIFISNLVKKNPQNFKSILEEDDQIVLNVLINSVFKLNDMGLGKILGEIIEIKEITPLLLDCKLLPIAIKKAANIAVVKGGYNSHGMLFKSLFRHARKILMNLTEDVFLSLMNKVLDENGGIFYSEGGQLRDIIGVCIAGCEEDCYADIVAVLARVYANSLIEAGVRKTQHASIAFSRTAPQDLCLSHDKYKNLRAVVYYLERLYSGRPGYSKYGIYVSIQAAVAEIVKAKGS